MEFDRATLVQFQKWFKDSMIRIICLGMVVKDIVFYVNQIPSTPQKITAESFEEKFGGMAATAAAAACAAAWGGVGPP